MNTQEQLQPPSEVFIRPLLELRDYYAGLAQEYQRLFIEARSQLDHVEALLSPWSCPDEHEVSELATGDPQGSRLFLASDHQSDLDLLESVESEPSHSQEWKTNGSSAASTKAAVSHARNTSLDSYEHFTKGAEIPMLPEYQSLTRMEALRILLHEYAGTVCHIDFIVRSLYGELESTIFKIVKGRVQSSLTQGRERGYWSAIPNEPGCYTLALSLLDPNHHNGSSTRSKSRRKKPVAVTHSNDIPMLKKYEGQFLIDALTSFLGEHRGRVFGVNEVINGIYGELDDRDMREVKNKVLNELSRGHRTGRFSRVPNQIGFYTWDARMISRRM
ncbi:hypothetical protein PN497_23560 [Sphaerospermopsis kisseleviana CS-549]|uniref:Uncharacterized protein n=1 Tax=Sphaerospermopsis kisseleviana CS-549 TaxID=3021783 RepID=A0ABT4ZZZ0_9CYAN|nr:MULTISPECIES: hypothetical protein [Sphaerospermopsis]MBD2132800.1 hypothetical protein [Sphaerospermopsis sp. FACHB-1094]MBD2144808.1 hypothetical protein [Sphaerospermopsis sp. FACHB-1194]MDB9444308.1 hypothetical protein [Sphaerospermopsis kisseleviana CS-549]BAZ82798.1 hypothetical protein NIES73_40810 [Sphaerospermopsis kisseleviana NIES-73]